MSSQTIEINQIIKFLPHAYPFLLVDRVIEMGEKHIVAIKNVTYNEPFFVGHFPGNPIMPGVLQLEAMAQAVGIFTAKYFNLDLKEKSIYFLGMDDVRFRRKVIPGDQLIIRVEATQVNPSRSTSRGVITVNGEVASEATLRTLLR